MVGAAPKRRSGARSDPQPHSPSGFPGCRRLRPRCRRQVPATAEHSRFRPYLPPGRSVTGVARWPSSSWKRCTPVLVPRFADWHSCCRVSAPTGIRFLNPRVLSRVRPAARARPTGGVASDGPPDRTRHGPDSARPWAGTLTQAGRGHRAACRHTSTVVVGFSGKHRGSAGPSGDVQQPVTAPWGQNAAGTAAPPPAARESASAVSCPTGSTNGPPRPHAPSARSTPSATAPTVPRASMPSCGREGAESAASASPG